MMLSLVPMDVFGVSTTSQRAEPHPHYELYTITINMADMNHLLASPTSLTLDITLNNYATFPAAIGQMRWMDPAQQALAPFPEAGVPSTANAQWTGLSPISPGAFAPGRGGAAGTATDDIARTNPGIVFTTRAAINPRAVTNVTRGPADSSPITAGTALNASNFADLVMHRVGPNRLLVSFDLTSGVGLSTFLVPGPTGQVTNLPGLLSGHISFEIPIIANNVNGAVSVSHLGGQVLVPSRPLILAPAGFFNIEQQGDTLPIFDGGLRLGLASPVARTINNRNTDVQSNFGGVENAIRLNERVAQGVGAMVQGNVGSDSTMTVVDVRLTAPAGYVWARNAFAAEHNGHVQTLLPVNQGFDIVSVRIPDPGTWAVGANPGGIHANVGERSRLDISVLIDVRDFDDALRRLPDALVITGFWLIPLEAAPSTGNVNVQVATAMRYANTQEIIDRAVQENFAAALDTFSLSNDAAHAAGTGRQITVGTRATATSTLTRVTEPTRRFTGVRGNDPWNNNPWSARIRYDEAAPFHGGTATGWGDIITFSVVEPGVQIVNARVRWNRAHTADWEWGIGSVTTDNQGRLTNYQLTRDQVAAARSPHMVEVFLPHALTPGQRRFLEIEFQFALEPGFEARHGSDVTVVVGGSLIDNVTGSDTFVVSTAVDPITVTSAGDIVQTTVGQVQNMVGPTPVANVVVTENYVGALAPGTEIWVRRAGGLGPFGTYLSAPTLTVDSGALRLAGPVTRSHINTGENFHVFTVTHRSQGNAPASFTLSNMEISGFVLPGVRYTVEVVPIHANNSNNSSDIFVAQMADGTRQAGANGWFNTNAYDVEVIEFNVFFDQDFVAPPAPGPGPGQQPGQQPGPGQVPQVPDNAIHTFGRNNVDSNNAPAITSQAGRDYISLRFLAEEVLGGNAVWSEEHNAAEITGVRNVEGYTLSVFFNDEEGVRRMVAGRAIESIPTLGGMRNINGTNYVTFSAAQAIFGFMTGQANGTFYVAP
jgi:hypothetical protein